jgi:hypothetical protein
MDYKKGQCCSRDPHFNVQHGNTRLDYVRIDSTENSVTFNTLNLIIGGKTVNTSKGGITVWTLTSATKNGSSIAGSVTNLNNIQGYTSQVTGTFNVAGLISGTTSITPTIDYKGTNGTVIVNPQAGALTIGVPTITVTMLTLTTQRVIIAYTLLGGADNPIPTNYVINFVLTYGTDTTTTTNISLVNMLSLMNFAGAGASNTGMLDIELFLYNENQSVNPKMPLILLSDPTNTTVDGFRKPCTININRAPAGYEDLDIILFCLSNDMMVSSDRLDSTTGTNFASCNGSGNCTYHTSGTP